MDKKIHSYTHTMDEEWIFKLIINIDTSDKLCRHLVEIERPSPPPGPPPLQSSISMEISQADKGNLGKSIKVYSKDKGMQTQVCKNGAQFHYNLFSLTSHPPSMLPSSSIYIPSMIIEGSNCNVSRHMEGQELIYSLLYEGKLQIFIF